MTSYVRKVDIVKDSANVAGRKKIVYVDASSDTTVPAGSKEIITIQPPQGKIWRVVYVYFTVGAPSGASSGIHYWTLCNSHLIATLVPYVSSTHNSNLQVRLAPVTYSSLFPNDFDVFARYIQSVVGNHASPVKSQYVNETDADQTNARIIRLLLEEEDEAT